MGLSKSKSKTTNDPWKPAQPFIIKNLQDQSAVFNSTQPQLEGFAAQQRDTYGRIAPGAEQGIMGAQSLVNRNLSGANLQGNPYLDAILGQTRDNVMARVGDEFGSAGRFGGGMHQAIAAREALNAENAMRYQDYGQERAYQQDAIGQAGQMMQGSQSILNNAAELPWLGIQASNGAVRQASNGYGTSSTTSKQALGPMLLNAAASAAQSAAMASDRRLKRKIKLLSRAKDGLGFYSWTYLNGKKAVGVMADEVAKLRPWALGPKIEGFATVNMGAL
ncbi:hypothetical protein SH584_11510 [Sphingomonas sp. LY29]|uniref:tail fiber domain-containing protein n=1 Tax=Sphingomonas sp. LY29 TaxID=3095341 RepID=UPI002D770CB7|nr:hypothetical protein [Sphingomonas sp. LY29]WRP25659.1 hypothetical protein SH584_11510 [Sphingomonas sp. LY29]